MDHVWLCSSKTAEENEENIKLNVSLNKQKITSSLVIELFVLKNNIDQYFFPGNRLQN